MNIIDLHIHSTASDGSDSIPELLNKIRSAGIQFFSVTDHDTMDGAVEMDALVPTGVQYIRGIEFSCITPRGKCHILGYGYDPADPVFLDALDQGRKLRQEKMDRRIEGLETQFGITLTEEESRWLHAQKSPGKPHLGRILVNRGLAADLKTAIATYINPFDRGSDRIDAATAIRAITHAGGIPVWAHPLGGEGEKRLTQEGFFAQLELLTTLGIRGMECHYSRYTPAEAAFLEEQANIHGLPVSAGSDYHGDNKPNLHLGKLNTESADVDPRRITILQHS